MERPLRHPYQGISNIVRFNWHYYVLAVALIFSLGIITPFLGYVYTLPMTMLMAAITIRTAISLFVSYYIYDASDLYSLSWLQKLVIDNNSVLVNINAGFDETSAIISNKYPANKLWVFDFYNPEKHTEVSIERARKAYPSFPGTQIISTTNIPIADGSADYLLLIMAAHEIRDSVERIQFFKLLNKKLASNGRVVVVEHQRDLANFLAFNFGFFHFYSPANWENTFRESGFKIESKTKHTSFISIDRLAKNGTTP